MDLHFDDLQYTHASPPVQIFLDVTYCNDPDLNALRSLTTSEVFYEIVKGALTIGRVKNDFLGLGLTPPEVIQNITLVDAHSLLVRVGLLEKNTSNLESTLDNCKASMHQYNIKGIVVSDEQPLLPDASKITSVHDYHRNSQKPRPPSPQNAGILPSLTQYEMEVPPQYNGFTTTQTSLVAHGGMRTPPESPVRPRRGEIGRPHSDLRGSLSDEEAIREELEQEMRNDFESILQERMAELQSAFNQEKKELETCGETLRAEFEALLAERLAEVQAEFNSKERELQANIAHAEGRANHERLLRLRHEGHVSATSPNDHLSHSKLGANQGADSAGTRHTFERQIFAATLEAKLQGRRLKDMRHQWEQSEERLAQSQCQLENMMKDIQRYQDALCLAKDRLAEVEGQTRGEDCMNVIKNARERDDSDGPDMSMSRSLGETKYDSSGNPTTIHYSTVHCSACDVKQRSLRLSELYVRTLELRMSMSERRVTQTENLTVRLVDALQEERRRRNNAEALILVERQKRHDAEAGGEAIAREVESPFVVPRLLDLFLKFEGFMDDVIGV